MRIESARVIWKFTIPLRDSSVIGMPQGAKILHVREQNSQPTLWAEVDPKAPQKPRKIHVRGTGHVVSNKTGDYLGTVQIHPYVWHIYDGGEFPC